MCRMSKLFSTFDHKRQFWVLQLFGWSAWGVGKYLLTLSTFEDKFPPHYGIYVLSITVIAILITLVLRVLYRALWERPIWLRALAFLLGSAAAGYAWYEARGYIFTRWVSENEETKTWLEKAGDAAEIYERLSYMSAYSTPIWIMAAWSVLYFGIKYQRVFQEYRESALKSAAMAHEAQLKMLRYQLNPHFLFNTLNAISTLVLEKQIEQANHMVTKLSSF
ncbi:MAG: two-component system LytT family sensor kinase, partial [Lysobacterales bacterium]